MKIAIAAAALLILVGGIWYLKTQNEPDTAPLDEGATANETPAEDDASGEAMDTEEHDMPSGTDAGMEFPIMDSELGLSVDPDAKVFDVSGRKFAFSMEEIRVEEGDTVQINFSSTDGLHDFVIDEFEGARTAEVETGESTSITFVADRAGTYEFYCSVGEHREKGMVGTFIVE